MDLRAGAREMVHLVRIHTRLLYLRCSYVSVSNFSNAPKALITQRPREPKTHLKL